MTGGVRVERDGAVAWLVLDNEARRNALTATMLAEGLDAVASLAVDASVRVVVLRGAGERAFVSGADIATLREDGEDPRILELARAISALGVPVVAALRGWCLGAGVLLALAADIRVAADDVRMGIPAAKLGVAYPVEGVDRLRAVAGEAMAAELLMTAAPIGVDRAAQAGLVNLVVAAETVFVEVAAMAQTIAANAPLSVRAAKHALRGADDAAEVIRACFASDDFAEGRSAFAEKRAPQFRGR
jgi:enoyl-CoA hydratase/carnithine racemase